MAALVLDASASGVFLFREEQTALTAALIARIGTEGAAVPSIWAFEIANLLRQAERRGRLDASGVAMAESLLRSLRIGIEPAEPALTTGPVLAPARRHILTAYDAAHLELALRRRIPLATRDGALLAAARAEGVALLQG